MNESLVFFYIIEDFFILMVFKFYEIIMLYFIIYNIRYINIIWMIVLWLIKHQDLGFKSGHRFNLMVGMDSLNWIKLLLSS